MQIMARVVETRTPGPIEGPSADQGTAADHRREPAPDRVLGHLVEVNGRFGVVTSLMGNGANGSHWSVGHLITIVHLDVRMVGVVSMLAASERVWVDADTNIVHVTVELIGEIVDDAAGLPRFSRGLHSYPALGAVAHRIRSRDLAAIFASRNNDGVAIGHLTQNETIAAEVNIHRMVNRHFAVIGSTGVGKTTAVAILIQKSIELRKNLRVLIMDPHNEYKEHFHDNSIVFDSSTLDLPFWMFRFDELADIVFSGRVPGLNESEALFELVKAAKAKFAATQTATMGIRRPSAPGQSALSADTPVPYRMTDAIQIVDDWIGKLDPPYQRADLRVLKSRLENLNRDPRYRFMFGNSLVEDTMATNMARLFRTPINGAPVSIVQLAGLPNEVLNSVVSVLARLTFDLALWSEGSYEIALVCEEAHRYIPNDRALGFAPTRQAIGRIAKEGRKYGASLCVVSQRPSELDATVLSQCSTMFAMRLPNEADQAIIRSAVGESSATVLGFLSSVADREAIAFGEAVAIAMRMKFDTYTPPKSNADDHVRPGSQADTRARPFDMRRMVARLRDEAV
ncbi:MAG: ATP-binding protein [Roseiarcus sp.]